MHLAQPNRAKPTVVTIKPKSLAQVRREETFLAPFTFVIGEPSHIRWPIHNPTWAPVKCTNSQNNQSPKELSTKAQHLVKMGEKKLWETTPFPVHWGML